MDVLGVADAMEGKEATKEHVCPRESLLMGELLV